MNYADYFSLAGRSALVTGGTSGIGEMMARGLLLGGARVFIVGRNPDTCAIKAGELSEHGDCGWIAADLADPGSIDALAAQTTEKAPDLGIVVNNAGITARAPFGEFPLENWNAVLGVNLVAPFMLVQALHPLLKVNATAERPSQVINTGSVAGLTAASPDSYAYGSSKAALHHLTRILARKLAPEHIHVNTVAAGMFPSKMTEWVIGDESMSSRALSAIPTGRFGTADDIAAISIAIASNRYMTGAVIPFDGGLALMT